MITIGIITYNKNGKYPQLVDSGLLESIAVDDSYIDHVNHIHILVNEDIASSPELEAELDRLGLSSRTSYYCKKFDQVPKARNYMIDKLQFISPESWMFMPDDDDKLLPHAIEAMGLATKHVMEYDTPLLLTFNGLRGTVVPNNKSVRRDNIYHEANGYLNWNMLFPPCYFDHNDLRYPEYLDPPYRSHDTVLAVTEILKHHDQCYVLLANPIIDYKVPTKDTLSTRTKRPDTPLHDALEYLYEGNDAHYIDDIIYMKNGSVYHLTFDEYKALDL